MTERDLKVGFRVSDDYIAQHPEADPTATELIINLFYTAQLLHSHMDRFLQQYELSGGAFNLLQITRGASGPITPSEIGEQLIITTATVTGLLDTLQRRGLISRTRDSVDRRRVLVDITPEGSTLLGRIDKELIQREQTWSSGVTGAARETMIRRLGQMQTHIRNLPPER